ncbi:hypothetical protein BCR34DRAFT_248733 [Clohesyomyces aquaticus]|uniref:Uncharacterized protein n=1 Tax=Clohesyomyces aquaticus TaxID=1231657 RepID=A0A1Y1Y523_9PLEO|nr:hypothetical protein BCR34DRAFT_248733 [Clohesyomyces aquaticus]
MPLILSLTSLHFHSSPISLLTTRVTAPAPVPRVVKCDLTLSISNQRIRLRYSFVLVSIISIQKDHSRQPRSFHQSTWREVGQGTLGFLYIPACKGPQSLQGRAQYEPKTPQTQPRSITSPHSTNLSRLAPCPPFPASNLLSASSSTGGSPGLPAPRHLSVAPDPALGQEQPSTPCQACRLSASALRQ